MALSTLYIATLAGMDGSVRRRRTRALALATGALLVTAAMSFAPTSVFAQSAGDRQYADPLAGDNGGGQQPESQQQSGAGNSAGETDTAPPTGAPAPSADSDVTAAESAALPRTGANATLLAVVGLALLSLAALVRPRSNRRAAR